MMVTRLLVSPIVVTALALLTSPAVAEDWPQHKLDSRNSGDASDRQLSLPMGFVGAVPLSDAIFTSPAVVHNRVYVVDGSGVAYCIDSGTREVLWSTESGGGALNCNNVSSPAIVGDYMHFGTMTGRYLVLNRHSGKVVEAIECGDPIFSSPAVVEDRVYFATLGSSVFCVGARGNLHWEWDFVREVMGFEGDRWNGEDWREFKGGRVDWRDHFCCSRNLSADGKRIVIPAGGRTVFFA